MTSKQYGLILPGQQKKKPIAPPTKELSRPSIFDESSETSSDDDAPKSMKTKVAIGPGVMDRRMARQMQAKALAEDPTVYQYDELYDEIEAKREEQQEAKKNEPKKPKYIGRLVKYAERRKLENEMRIERQILKEREAEGEQFKDKEAFVTQAYRKKLEEMRKLQEEAQRDEYLEAIGDVTKQKDLDGFYRHIYEQKLGTAQEVQKPGMTTSKTEEVDEDAAAAYKPIKSDNKPQQRVYRKRKTSEDEEKADAESDSEKPTAATETKKIHLQNNMDADSDFSIDSSSDSENKEVVQKKSPGVKKKDVASSEDISAVKQTDPNKIAINLGSAETAKKHNEPEKENGHKKDGDVTSEQMPPPKPKRDKSEIWRKRTVGEIFDAALQRYYERKAARNG